MSKVWNSSDKLSGCRAEASEADDDELLFMNLKRRVVTIKNYYHVLHVGFL
jgi:hypothetical protein